jgi:hypothetical protein
MCSVSAIGGEWKKSVPQTYPWLTSYIALPNTSTTPPAITYTAPDVGREEFDRLKNEVEELKVLLRAAKKFDEATGQPDCEVDEKVALIKRVAELVGVDMGDVFDTPQP